MRFVKIAAICFFVSTAGEATAVSGQWSGILTSIDGLQSSVFADISLPAKYDDVGASIKVNGLEQHSSGVVDDRGTYHFRLSGPLPAAAPGYCYDVLMINRSEADNLVASMARVSGSYCSSYVFYATGFLARVGETGLVQNKDLILDRVDGGGYLLARFDDPSRKKTVLVSEDLFLIFELDPSLTTMVGHGLLSPKSPFISHVECVGNFLNGIPCIGTITVSGSSSGIEIRPR